MNDLLWRVNRLLGDKLARDAISEARATIALPPISVCYSASMLLSCKCHYPRVR